MNQFMFRKEDLTPEWFTAALKSSELLCGGTVSHVSLTPIGAGLMASIYHTTLTLTGASKASVSLITKLPVEDADGRALCIKAGIYEPEVGFYTDIAPRITMRVPDCYYARFDSESGLFVLLLEDLSEGTSPGDVVAGGTVDVAARAIEALVGLHGPLWTATDLSSRSWLDHQRTLQLFGALPAGLEPFLSRFNGLTSDQIKVIQRSLPLARHWVMQWKGPSVVLHGDYRLDNMLFSKGSAKNELIVLDWQTVRLGPPLIDAAYYLASSLSVSDRRSNERQLIRLYHDGLMASGVKHFSFEDCWQNYRLGSLYGLMIAVGLGASTKQTERGDAMQVASVGRYADLVLDIDAVKLLE